MGNKRDSKDNRFWDADNRPAPKPSNEFEALIGEKVDPKLRYEHDGKANVVRVYKMESRRSRVLWALGKYILICGITTLIVLFAFPALEKLFLWSNINKDFMIIWSVILFLLVVMEDRIKRRFFKSEPLYEIKLDERKSKEYVRSNKRVAIVVAVIVAALYLFLIGSGSYTLTYLRFLWDGGYGRNVTTVHGNIEEDLRFDGSSTVITGAIKGTPGTMEQIKLYLDVEKCPDTVYVYINGDKADIIDSDYIRVSSYFYGESYFENVIFADVEFHAQETNTLEIKAGGFNKEWTFEMEQEKN